MIRILFVDVGWTLIAENGEEEEEISGEGALKAEDEQDEDEYVEEERDGENAPFEGERVRVEVEYVDMGLGSQGIEEG